LVDAAHDAATFRQTGASACSSAQAKLQNRWFTSQSCAIGCAYGLVAVGVAVVEFDSLRLGDALPVGETAESLAGAELVPAEFAGDWDAEPAEADGLLPPGPKPAPVAEPVLVAAPLFMFKSNCWIGSFAVARLTNSAQVRAGKEPPVNDPKPPVPLRLMGFPAESSLVNMKAAVIVGV
jgi:hypothetical protein